jgi:outer membrane protein insertion porin family
MKRPALILMAMFFVLFAREDALGAWKRAPGGPVVRSLKIVGSTQLGESRVRAAMRTRQSKMLRKRHLRESTLESDLMSIVALYNRNGFLEATAAVEEKQFDKDRANVWITIRVSEGRQTMVREVVLDGNARVTTDALHRFLTIRVGQPLDQRKIGEDEYSIYAYYADRGFVFASISHQIEAADGAASVKYVIREGGPANIAEVDVGGTSKVSDRLVRREVTLKRGDIFSRQKVLDSQQRLYDTGFFKDVTIEPTQSAEDSGAVTGTCSTPAFSWRPGPYLPAAISPRG